jgi:hypothetical protein
MKRALLLAALVAALMGLAAPLALAQEDHGEVGVQGDYLRLAPINTNLYGVGARVSFNVRSHAQLEGEMAYDFTQSFSTEIPCIDSPGCPPTFQSSTLHAWQGLFGPKIQTTGPVRLFAFAKGGFLNLAGIPSFQQQVGTFGGNSTYGVFYPGGGVEGYLGKIGLRLDVGDEMYFNNGAHNSLKVTFGPTIRF